MEVLAGIAGSKLFRHLVGRLLGLIDLVDGVLQDFRKIGNAS